MNNPTIDGVSRELLTDLVKIASRNVRSAWSGSICEEARALLDAPVEPFNLDGWGIDHSAGRPILVHNKCSVIEAEQAYGLLELINAAKDAPTNDLREHCKQCAEVVKTWPEWKRGCLGGEPVVERRPVCATCNGTRVVDDGELTHSSGGIPYENGPIKCVKDCPDCQGSPEVAALQSTIAQLQAEQQLLQSTVARYLDRIAELESGRGEPVAYLRNEGVPNNLVVCGFDNPDAFKVFKAPPAPVASLWEICVRDEPGNPESPCEYVYASSASERDAILRQGGASLYAEYACLDAAAALNEVRK